MKISYIELAGARHPVCFSLSAIEEIEDRFGGLDEMRKELTGGKVKAINAVLEIMMDAGRAYCKAMGMDLPDKLPCRPGDLIDVRDEAVVQQIFGAMSGDTGRTVEVRGKN